MERSRPWLTICRLLLGLIFVLFGINYWMPFIPIPEHPPAAHDYLAALAATGFFYPVLKGTEVLSGALLLAGAHVPLALVLLAPIVVQIVLFHVFLAPGGLGFIALIAALELAVAWGYRDAFAGMLRR